jgi:hypothetical protein
MAGRPSYARARGPTSAKAKRKAPIKKRQGKARKAGYLQRRKDYGDTLRSQGFPEELIPTVKAVLTDEGMIIPPNDAKASDSYLKRFNELSAPLRMQATVRGLVGYPTTAPAVPCERCGGDGFEPTQERAPNRRRTKADNCTACEGKGAVPSGIYLKPDAKILQVADERAHGKPKQSVEHGIDEGTRDLIERVLTGERREIRAIPTTAEIIDDEDDDA